MGAARQALEEGNGGVVALTGDPGIGKSRLLDEALASIAQRIAGLEVLRTQCRAYDQTAPYAPVARLLRQTLRADPAEPAAAQAARAHDMLRAQLPAWERFAPLLLPLLGLPPNDNEITTALSAEQRRERLHDLLAQLWVAAARDRPLLLMIDDLQWADASSREVFLHLAADAAAHPLLLVLSHRPDAALDVAWGDPERTTSIALQPLSAGNSAELVRALLGGDAPAEIGPFVERSGGTPFFLEEMVRYLIGARVIRRTSAGGWETQPFPDVAAIPRDIDQLVSARLDQLDAAARGLLQQAAVIGQHFDRDVLAALATDQPNIGQQLDALIAASFVERVAGTPNGYHFRHALTRDVAYNGLLFAHRRELHARVAAAIAEREVAQPALLAAHYRAAELPDHAFPHFVAAAEAAAGRYANREALALYEQVLATAPWRHTPDAPPDLAATTTVFEALGDVLALLSEYERAQENYGWLLHLYERHGGENTLRQAALQRKLGATYESQGALDQALEWFTRAGGLLAQAPESDECALEQARVLSDTGWIFFRRQDLNQAQQYLERALGAVAPLGNDQEEANILNRLGGVAWTRGDVAQARQYVEQRLAASERSGDLVGQAWSLMNLGLLAQSRDALAEAVAYGVAAAKIADRIANRRMHAMVLVNLGWVYYDDGEYDQAHSVFTKGVGL